MIVVATTLRSRELDSDCCLCCRAVRRAGLGGRAGAQHRHPFHCIHFVQQRKIVRGLRAGGSGFDEGWAGGSGVRVLAKEPAASGCPWPTAIGWGAKSINDGLSATSAGDEWVRWAQTTGRSWYT